MFLDRDLVRTWGDRVSHGDGVDVLVAAWHGLPAGQRAERLAANGDLLGAAATGAPGWESLLDGDVVAALRAARGGDDKRARRTTLLEAEALIAAGAIVAGLDHLRELSAAGSVPATLALARRQHALGDHRGAFVSASRLPMHCHATQVAIRALLALHQNAEALRRAEPFLDGGLPIPNAMSAGALAVLAAGALARLGHAARLRRFAQVLLDAPDAPPETAPTVARTAWIGGLARPAWERFGNEENPWSIAGRLELAALAGEPQLIRGLMARAGPLGGPAGDALALIEAPTGPFADRFEEDGTYHIWRTHPSRWQPWIDAAMQGPGRVETYDLAAEELPDRQTIPTLALDDGALVSRVMPVPVPIRQLPGQGVWIDGSLCAGIGIGHDWPDEEQEQLAAAVSPAPPQDAAVWVTGAERAMALARYGRPTVVLAPPGDPFWAGPLPQRAWPAFRIVRASPQGGWTGAAERVAQEVHELLGAAVEPTQMPPMSPSAAAPEEDAAATPSEGSAVPPASKSDAASEANAGAASEEAAPSAVPKENAAPTASDDAAAVPANAGADPEEGAAASDETPRVGS